VFTGLSGEYGGNYGPPAGFNWNGNDEPVEDNKALETYNAPSRVEDFIAQATAQAKMTRGSHVMWTMGSDFNYEAAEPWCACPRPSLAAHPPPPSHARAHTHADVDGDAGSATWTGSSRR
jgi:hypothetical protein